MNNGAPSSRDDQSKEPEQVGREWEPVRRPYWMLLRTQAWTAATLDDWILQHGVCTFQAGVFCERITRQDQPRALLLHDYHVQLEGQDQETTSRKK